MAEDVLGDQNERSLAVVANAVFASLFPKGAGRSEDTWLS